MIITNSEAVGGVGLPPECDRCHERHGLDIPCEVFAKSKCDLGEGTRMAPPSLSAFRPIASFNLQPLVTWMPTDRHRMEVGNPDTLEQLWRASNGQQEWRQVSLELYTADQAGPMCYEVYQNSTGELLGVYSDDDEDLALLQAAEEHHNVRIDDMFTKRTRVRPKPADPPFVTGKAYP